MPDATEGGALIHLRVPRALKARWVRMSRADGLRLTDWIVSRVERAGDGETRMNVRKIPEALARQYRGSGYALAAIQGDEIVALRYIVDVAPDDVYEQIADGGPHAAFFVRQWLNTAEARPVVRELQAVGEVSVGMCSAQEFVEL